MSRKRESIVPLILAAILVAAIPLYAVVIDPMIRKGNGLDATASRVVTIDINPSIELSVDASNLVLEAKALNRDAETLLATLTLKGLPAPEAVQRIVAAAVTLGFIDPAAVDTYVEIAVEDNGDGSQSDEKRLATDLMDSAAQGLRDKGAQGTIDVSEVVHARITEAAALDISAGRLNLIDRLAAALGQTREEVLAQYKDANVKQIMKALNVALGHGSGPTGTPGDPTSAPTDPAAPPTATLTPAATATPTPKPTATPTPKPTATPKPEPTVTPDVVGGATK